MLTCACRSCTKGNDSEVTQLHVAQLRGCYYGSKRDTSCALDIIVEHSVAFSVPIQQPTSIVNAKIFEVDVCFWKQLLRALYEALDKVIVLLTSDSVLLNSKVKVVITKLLIICAGIKDNTERPIWMNAGAHCSKGQLSDTDQDSAYALIANSKDLLSVTHDNIIDASTVRIGINKSTQTIFSLVRVCY